MARASLRGLEKRFGEVPALEGFDLEIADGELVAVVGPSGCGKSTLLRLIAGLEEATAGEVRLDGERIDDRPPAERDVAMVFQSYALYPHMSVRRNIEFPLRMRRVAPAERRERVAEVAGLLELEPLLERRPAELSGGQRQRVALARALVRRPRLFLLDEPLSNLDARLRASVRRSIRAIQRRLGVTTLYVTHDQTEAMTLGDRIVVLSRGRIEQVGAPLELYERPATTFVAGFLGSPPMNLLAGRLADGSVEVGGERIALAAAESLGGLERVSVGVRPEAFAPCADGQRAERRGESLVARLEPGSAERLGSETVCAARLGSETLAVRLLGAGVELPERVAAPLSALHLFGPDGRRIELRGGRS